MREINVPICEKAALTIEEAAEYSNIGQNRLSELLKQPRCTFVLYVDLTTDTTINAIQKSPGVL